MAGIEVRFEGSEGDDPDEPLEYHMDWQSQMNLEYARVQDWLIQNEYIIVDEYQVRSESYNWSPKFLMLLNRDLDYFEENHGSSAGGVGCIAGFIKAGLWQLPKVNEFILVSALIGLAAVETKLREVATGEDTV